MNFGLIGIIVFGACGLFSISRGLCDIVTYKKLKTRCTDTVEATITDILYKAGVKNSSKYSKEDAYATYDFQYDGMSHTIMPKIEGVPQDKEIGDTVTIYVNPINYAIYAEGTLGRIIYKALMTIFGGLVFIGFALCCYNNFL